MDGVKQRDVFVVAALGRPLRAATARRFSQLVAAELGANLSPKILESWSREILGGVPPRDDATALRRLLAEDVSELLPHLDAARASISAWCSSEERLHSVFTALHATLAACGIDFDQPPLWLVDDLPRGYDSPTLDAVSIDAADASEYGVAAGVYYRRDRARPFASESTLGHVLLHAALGQRNPALLGRGLEEGLCEVLGGLWAAARVSDAHMIDRVWLDRNVITEASPARLELMAHTRAAAWILRDVGMEGLARLVDGGRPAIRALESQLSTSRAAKSDDVGSTPLSLRLDRLLQLSIAPRLTRPLLYYVARELSVGTTLVEAARRLDLPLELVARSARELAESTYLLVIDRQGSVLASDVMKLIQTSHLRYDPDGIPMGTNANGAPRKPVGDGPVSERLFFSRPRPPRT